MSFTQAFEKISRDPSRMSDMELFLKTDKHLRKAVKHEYSPHTGAGVGAAAGGAVGLGGKYLRKTPKPRTWKGLAGVSALGAAAGAGTGYVVKKFHQSRLRKYVTELSTRGYYPSSRGGRISWKRYQSSIS